MKPRSVRPARAGRTAAVLAAVLLAPAAPELSPLWGRLRDAAPAAGPTYPAAEPVKRIDLITVSPGIGVRR